MFINFIFELRKHGLHVGLNETLALAQALIHDLHESSLTGFYHMARALCVHREADLDAFDQAFAFYFRGDKTEALDISNQLQEWLRDPRRLLELSEETRARLQSLDLDELRRQFEERIREQKERHDSGSRWIGTGGTSPFGSGGFHPSGIRLGQGGGRSAIAVAQARLFREYRTDVILDTRSIELALRRLKGLSYEQGTRAFDLDATIDATARDAGELNVVFTTPKKHHPKVLLLMDVGGSMDPHADLVSRLFSAAKRAVNLHTVEHYYFHNAIYGRLFRDAMLRESVLVRDVLARCDERWKLIVVGDALMHPAELFGAAWDANVHDPHERNRPAIDWFYELTHHFSSQAWLNPEPKHFWTGTAEILARIFSMYELTLDGLAQAVAHVSRTKE